MKMEDYDLLLKLYEVGTIRGTAKAIHISQPAVTQRLKYMEAYFQETIFIRTSKQLVPTPPGERILKHAREVVEREAAFKNQLAASSNDVKGTLSIACSSLISQRFLPSILAEFTRLYPKVAIDLVTGLSEDIKQDHHHYQVCIIRGEPLKGAVCQRLFDDPLYIFDTEPFPDDRIKERALISFKSDDSMHEAVDHWLYYQQDKIKPLKTITVDQIETCKQFMKEGLGMAVLPESVAEQMMDEYPHASLQLHGEKVTRSTWTCYQEGARKLPQTDRFLQLMEKKRFV